MGKKKQPKPRNHVVKNMIERSQKAGYHIDQRKEDEKYLCREDILEEEWEDDEEELLESE